MWFVQEIAVNNAAVLLLEESTSFMVMYCYYVVSSTMTDHEKMRAVLIIYGEWIMAFIVSVD